MTKQNLIRILSGLMFLIFFCPFFQMCADDSLYKETSEAENKALPEEGHDTNTLNGYELGSQIFKIESDESDKGIFTEPLLYVYLCFTLTLALIAINFILSLSGKFKIVGATSGIIVLLNIIALTIATVTQTLKDTSQIKFGYYLFAINLVLIIMLCAKLKIKTMRDGINW